MMIAVRDPGLLAMWEATDRSSELRSIGFGKNRRKLGKMKIESRGQLTRMDFVRCWSEWLAERFILLSPQFFYVCFSDMRDEEAKNEIENCDSECVFMFYLRIGVCDRARNLQLHFAFYSIIPLI